MMMVPSHSGILKGLMVYIFYYDFTLHFNLLHLLRHLQISCIMFVFIILMNSGCRQKIGSKYYCRRDKNVM